MSNSLEIKQLERKLAEATATRETRCGAYLEAGRARDTAFAAWKYAASDVAVIENQIAAAKGEAA